MLLKNKRLQLILKIGSLMAVVTSSKHRGKTPWQKITAQNRVKLLIGWL